MHQGEATDSSKIPGDRGAGRVHGWLAGIQRLSLLMIRLRRPAAAGGIEGWTQLGPAWSSGRQDDIVCTLVDSGTALLLRAYQAARGQGGRWLPLPLPLLNGEGKVAEAVSAPQPPPLAVLRYTQR
jgi:hypothetical protein